MYIYICYICVDITKIIFIVNINKLSIGKLYIYMLCKQYIYDVIYIYICDVIYIYNVICILCNIYINHVI